MGGDPTGRVGSRERWRPATRARVRAASGGLSDEKDSEIPDIVVMENGNDGIEYLKGS